MTPLLIPLLAVAALTPGESLQVAEQQFGVPACGEPTIEWVAPEAMWAGRMGEVRWRREGDALPICTVFLNTALLDTDETCEVIAHEVGHLDGLPHVADPKDVMSLLAPRQAYCHPLRERLFTTFAAWDEAEYRQQTDAGVIHWSTGWAFPGGPHRGPHLGR